MWKRLLPSLGALLAGAGLALAQSPEPPALEPGPQPTSLAGNQSGSPAPNDGKTTSTTAEHWTPFAQSGSSDPFYYPGHLNNPLEPRLYVDIEYMLFWLKDGPLGFPLVTTGNPANAVPGALGQSGTEPLFGGNGLNYKADSGLRLTGGLWFNDERTIGAEISAFLLNDNSTGFTAVSDINGNPPLYNPIFRPDLNREGSITIADPAVPLAGGVNIISHSRLFGAEVNGIIDMGPMNGLKVELLAGARYIGLDENLIIQEATVDTVHSVLDTAQDNFTTHNEYFGGQIGTRVGCCVGPVSMEFVGKLALGANREVVETLGSNTESGPGSANPGTFRGGIYTQPSNLGSQTHDQFAVVPEAELKLGYAIYKHVTAFVTYDLIYWNQVVRPGDEIDRSVNPTQSQNGKLIGPAPAPLFNRSDFWAQGLTFGLEFRF